MLPAPRPSGSCGCRCHEGFAWQVAPEAMPSIDAVTACASCVNNHCAVLLERRVWFGPALEPTPWIDPPRPAEAVTDQGEGDERGD